MNWVQTSQQIRESMLNYARQFNGLDTSGLLEGDSISHFWTVLKDTTIDDLLSYLTSELGRNISLEDVADSYCNRDADQLPKIIKGEYSVPQLVSMADMENKQLKRLEILLEKPVFELNESEMEEKALFLFTLSQKEYESIASEKKIELEQMWNGPFEYHIDSTFLFGISSKVFDRNYSINGTIEKIGKLDFGFGMLQKPFSLWELRDAILNVLKEE